MAALGDGDPAAVGLAAIAGALAALAVAEAIRAAPGIVVWLRAAVEPLRRAGSEGYDPTIGERRRLGLIGAALVLGIGGWFGGVAPAAPLAAATPAAVGWTLALRSRRYRGTVERELPRIAAATADALAAGRSTRAALASAHGSVAGPAAAELGRLRSDLELGASLEAALEGLRRRLRSPRVDAFCVALTAQRLAGGDLVDLLRRFAHATEERDRIAADARSATAQARFTGALVAAMPVGAALLAELLAPGFVGGLLASGPALALLAIAGVLQVAGFAAIRRLARVAEP